jgi:hemerythrin
MPLEWEPGLSVGVEAIDVQHRQILRRMRCLDEAVRAGRPADTRAGLRFLTHYLADHFDEEESWMEQNGYPGLSEHRKAHRRCLDELKAMRNAFEVSADPAPLTRAAEALSRWLDEHMTGDDLQLGRFREARENLRRLAAGGPKAT